VSDAFWNALPLIIGAVGTVVVQIWNAIIVRKLERNTNSIKDALVKVTGEKEHARGLQEGRSQSDRAVGSGTP